MEWCTRPSGEAGRAAGGAVAGRGGRLRGGKERGWAGGQAGCGRWCGDRRAGGQRGAALGEGAACFWKGREEEGESPPTGALHPPAPGQLPSGSPVPSMCERACCLPPRK